MSPGRTNSFIKRAVRNGGFTLVECLIVIGAVGIFLAILMPLASSAWQAVGVTGCAHNLHILYQAECAWRAEHLASTFTQDARWQSQLMPYVEGCDRIFICPGAPTRMPGRVVGVTAADVAVNVYSDRSFTTYLGAVGLDSEWARRTQVGPSEYLYEIEDDIVGRYAPPPDFNDIRCTVWFKHGWLVKLCIEKPGVHISGYDLIIKGELVLHDVDLHIGEEIELSAQWQAGDYGLSKGTYEVAGQRIWMVDPRLILILDYPKPIADYSQDGGGDEWDKYFILDEDEWMAMYGDELEEGESWRDYQALRHFGKANVLFCDGHIELLGPEQLWETEPLWRYSEGMYASTSRNSAAPTAVASLPRTATLPLQAKPGAPAKWGAAARGKHAHEQGNPKGGQSLLETRDFEVDLKSPLWTVREPTPGVEVTFYWSCADAADVYLNGEPVRLYKPDFRTRRAQASAVFFARGVIRKGDVITVGARRGRSYGFLLVAVNQENKVVWKTDAKNWKAYFPANKGEWWLPGVAKSSDTEPVSVQPDPSPPQARINRRFGNVARSIWYEESQFAFLVSEIKQAGNQE